MPADWAGGASRPRIALVLGGGNALGAFHAGIYQALHEADIEPDWIIGTSIGAVTGAIIAGNRREHRLDRLHEFWRPEAERADWPMPWDIVPETWRRTGAVISTLLAGRPGVFGPLGSRSLGWVQDPSDAIPALYDSRALHDTLTGLVDFDLLNDREQRFSTLAVDIETGEEVEFTTTRQRLGPDHVRASAALITAFPAIEIDGRLVGDGGLSMNLPLDPVLAAADTTPTLCIAADLLPLASQRPKTLGEVMSRMQDLTFAAQSRRTIERWRAVYEARSSSAQPTPSVTIARLAYSDQAHEVAGKAMDFSPITVRQRWTSGYESAARFLRRLDSGEVATAGPGLSLVEG